MNQYSVNLETTPRRGATVRPGGGSRCDVAIIGAGPNGLAAQAALRSSELDVRVFGPPMSFWRERMPAGMLIRSPWPATHFAGPDSGLTLDDYQRVCGRPLVRERVFGQTVLHRLALEDFVAYGEWFRRQTCSDLDERRVEHVSAHGPGFRLRLEDGELVDAGRVVCAAGIEPFAARPAAFEDLPPGLAMHTTGLTDPAALAGARVLVVGAGQSALESAALLNESGADVEIAVRAPNVHWLSRSDRLHRLGPLTRVLYAPADIGPAGLSRLVAMPRTFSTVPVQTRRRLDRRAIKPAGSDWLVRRLRDVPIATGAEVISAQPHGSGVSVRLNPGGSRIVDRVVLGTGFRIDIRRYAFLAPDLPIRQLNGYPVLSRSFESSVRGLYFLGSPAAGTFGPVMRFVAGVPFSATRLAHHLASTDRERRAPAVPALESA